MWRNRDGRPACSRKHHLTFRKAAGYLHPLGKTMAIVRPLVVLLIAVAVALLPATLGTGRAVASADAAMSATMDDCCPDAGEPCDRTADTCPFMAACALKNFSFAGHDTAAGKLPLVQASVFAPDVAARLPSHLRSPPPHPPRI
jgi:hypothetical protein